jgi:hypothetical protein
MNTTQNKNSILMSLQLRHTSMDLLDQFVGLTFNHNDRFLVIWQATARCTLKVRRNAAKLIMT